MERRSHLSADPMKRRPFRRKTGLSTKRECKVAVGGQRTVAPTFTWGSPGRELTRVRVAGARGWEVGPGCRPRRGLPLMVGRGRIGRLPKNVQTPAASGQRGFSLAQERQQAAAVQSAPRYEMSKLMLSRAVRATGLRVTLPKDGHIFPEAVLNPNYLPVLHSAAEARISAMARSAHSERAGMSVGMVELLLAGLRSVSLADTVAAFKSR